MERALVFARFGLTIGFAVAVAAALALSACGRKGPLDLPPSDTAAPGTPMASSATVPPTATLLPGTSSTSGAPAGQDTSVKAGFDSRGQPQAAAGEKKPFILDFLLQ